MRKYQIIYADPPWEYQFQGTRGCADRVYPTMKLQDLKAMPVGGIASDKAVLFMWATCPQLPAALALMESWGFKYKTVAFTWVKTNKKTMGLHWGMGFYTRSNTEVVLLGVKGKRPPVLAHDIHQVVISDVMEHSHKPAIVRELIVRLFGDLPRIELFARKKVAG